MKIRFDKSVISKFPDVSINKINVTSLGHGDGVELLKSHQRLRDLDSAPEGRDRDHFAIFVLALKVLIS